MPKESRMRKQCVCFADTGISPVIVELKYRIIESLLWLVIDAPLIDPHSACEYSR